MTTTPVRRFDRTVRTVMWLDAFLSLAMVGVAVVVAPVAALLHVSHGIVFAIGLVSIVSGVLLAAFGAVTAVALMLRMRRGDYLLPARLRLPLPLPMRPDGVLAARSGSIGD
jgi:ABC-type transport system involved in cytochrome c biogenesis permease component